MTEQSDKDIWKDAEDEEQVESKEDTNDEVEEQVEDEDNEKDGDEDVEEKEDDEKDEVESEGIDYKSIVEWKIEHGELPEDFELPKDFDGTKEEYDELMNNYKSNLQKEALKPFQEFDEQSNGKLSYLLEHGTLEGFNEVTDYSTWDEKEIDDLKARKLLTEQYKSLGWSDDKIKTKLDRLADIDELEEEAKLALPAAKKKSEQYKKEVAKQQEIQKEQEAKAQEQFVTEFNSNIDSMDEFLGIKVNKTLKDKVKRNAQDTSKKINENWSKYSGVLALLDQLGILDGKSDKLDKIYTKKTTKRIRNQYTPDPFKKRKAKGNKTHESITELNQSFIESLS